jgi:hypothetical protein
MVGFGIRELNMNLKIGDIVIHNKDIGIILSFSKNTVHIYWNDGVTRSLYTDVLRNILSNKKWEHHDI